MMSSADTNNINSGSGSASASVSCSATGLRQPEFHNAASSFSTAEQLLNKLGTYEASNIFNETDTSLVQEIPEGIGDETEEARLLADLKFKSSDGSAQKQAEEARTASHWNSQVAADPAPLRQPNLAAVPPEVLGALLKNENYGTFDAVLAQSVTENHPSSSAKLMDPLEKDPIPTSSAGDGEAERTKTSDSTGAAPDNALTPIPNVSTNPIKFSPHAKEFVPRGFSAGGVGNVTSKVSSLSLKPTNSRPSDYSNLEELQGYPVNPDYPYPNEFSFESLPPEIKNTCVLDTVSQAINQLKRTPAEFDYVIKETIEMLHSYLSDVDTLQIIATMIMTESIAHMNFTYLGARMCGELVKEGVEVNGKSFKEILLSRCDERFKLTIAEFKKKNGNTTAPLPADIHGFTQFFGELYMNVKVEKNGVLEKYAVLGLAVLELLEYLAKTKNSDDVKFVAQILKLVGWQLEHNSDSTGKIRQYLDSVFNELDKGKTSKDITPASLAIIENLKKLRQRDWDYVPEDVGAGEDTGAAGVSWPQVDTHPIYELPDEFDDEWDEDEVDDENAIFLDDEPDDVQAAYEDFLREQKQHTKS